MSCQCHPHTGVQQQFRPPSPESPPWRVKEDPTESWSATLLVPFPTCTPTDGITVLLHSQASQTGPQTTLGHEVSEPGLATFLGSTDLLP
jgi:hypothetical protein